MINKLIISLILSYLSISCVLATENDRVEFWFYKTQLNSSNYADQAQLRLYLGTEILNSKWNANLQLSTAAGYVVGPAFKNTPTSQWEPGNTRLTFTIDTPKVNDINFTAGLRYYTPIGNPDPAFNTEQQEIGPEIAFGWSKSSERNLSLTKVKPLIRYMNGFNPEAANIKTIKVLEVLPEAVFQIFPNNKILLWNHNGILINERNGKLVVPIDVQYEKDINKDFSVRLGTTLPLYDELHKNIWQGYTSLVFRF